MEKFFKELLDNALEVLKKFNVFSGRASRKEFWMFVLAAFLGGVALAILSAIPFLGRLFSIIASLYQLGIIVLSLSVGIRRLHDVNKSGKLMIPYIIGFVPLIILTFITGTVLSRSTYALGLYGYMTGFSMIYIFGILSVLFGIIAAVFGIILLVFWIREGDPGANKYGPKPSA
jgi:uncharacterized membrane protein YhaH (DUF805 family)